MAGLGEQVRVALEDVRDVSARLEPALIESGLSVCRVPPRLMGQARRAGRQRGKSDPIDAIALARAALANPELPLARLAGPELELPLLISHREDLVGERTRIQARLRGHLHLLIPAWRCPRGRSSARSGSIVSPLAWSRWTRRAPGSPPSWSPTAGP